MKREIYTSASHRKQITLKAQVAMIYVSVFSVGKQINGSFKMCDDVFM
jgi:hypothetical protein